MRSIWLIGAATLGACTAVPEPLAGQALFEDHCVVCHGLDATGNGPLADTLPVRPADLTRLSARNGGVFPQERAMARIHGYPGRFQPMPGFGPVLGGPDVIWHDADGMAVETPKALLDLIAYLAGLQQNG